jgi:hypothetical protein
MTVKHFGNTFLFRNFYYCILARRKILENTLVPGYWADGVELSDVAEGVTARERQGTT